MTTISVITICLNAAEHIEQAIESVEAQTYHHIEYLVIDGGSTDGTLGVVERHEKRVDYLVSEPDGGLYNAMNKGIQAATGEVLFFLNADDRFCDAEVVGDLMSAFREDPELEVVYGNALHDLPGGYRRWVQCSELTRRSLAKQTISHQTIFSRRRVFEKTGGFNENYRVVSDLEWLIKLSIKGVVSRHVDRDVSIVGVDGRSWVTAWEDERLRMMRRYYSAFEIFCWRTLPKFPPIRWLPVRWAIHLTQVAIDRKYRMAWLERRRARRSRQ